MYRLIVTSSHTDTQPPRILPPIDDVSAPYWTGGAVGELRVGHCDRCNRYVHPPRATCPDCEAPLRFVAVSGAGTVFSYTVSYQQFHPAVPTPFVIALVELDEQPDLRVVTNIVDCEPESVYSGMPVRVRFERQDTDDVAVFVPVFAPR